MKNRILKILGIIIALIVMLNPIVMAASNAEIEQNEKKIDELKEQKTDVQEEKSSVQDEVDDLNSQIEDYQAQIGELDSKINDLNNKISESEKKLEEAQKQYDDNKSLAEERLVVMQESGDTTYLDMLLTSSSITDFISNYYLASELAEADTELLDSIEKEKQEVESAKTELENSKQELDNSKTAKQSVASQLQVAKNEKSEKVSELSEEEQDLQEEIDQLVEDNQQILNEIKIAQQKYQAQLEALQNQASSSNSGGGHSGGTTTGSGSGIFIVPIKSYSYISTNGYYSSGKFHGAIDYAASSGTPVYAAADGVVMSVKNLTSSYGTHIVIQHANGLQTWYAHGTSGSVSVSPGQTVKQGQQIMLSGNTGNSSGPHLHFEVRKSPYNYSYLAKKYGDDSRVNPNNYF